MMLVQCIMAVNTLWFVVTIVFLLTALLHLQGAVWVMEFSICGRLLVSDRVVC